MVNNRPLDMAEEPKEQSESLRHEGTPPTNSTATAPKFRWFASPIGALVSLIIGGLGLIGTFVTFFLAAQKPELTYAQQLVQAKIVRAGDLSRLGVTYNGKLVTSDITAVQVAIWNGGSKSIRSDDFLQPIVLQTDERIPILDAQVRYVTRDIIRFQIKADGAKPSELGLDFRILEPGDGAIVQLICAGRPEIDVSLSGVLIGQKRIRRQDILGTTVGGEYAPVSYFKRFAQTSTIFGLLSLLSLFGAANAFIGAVKLFRNPDWPKNRRKTGKVVAIVTFGFGLGFVAFVIWMARNLTSIGFGPPFNF